MRSPVIRRTTLLGTALATVAALALTACGGDSGSSSDSKTVTIWSSIDAPVQAGMEKKLNEKLKAANSDITIKWQQVQDINALIITKIQAGDTPDIALIPQPGVVKQMNSLGATKAMDDAVDMAALKDNMVAGSLDAGTIDGSLMGLLVSANVKGLVFYPKKAFDAAGYKAPTDIAGLDALTEQIKSDGGTPWCMGIESDTATGWPATDWIETLVMKYNGADVYNKWITNEVKFDSPEVKKATDEFSKLLFTDGNTLGGQSAIVSTNFGTAGNPMFDKAGPKCWLYNQGSFITGFFPKAVTSDLDANVGVFGFPPATAGGDNPVEGGGDMMTMLNDSDNVKTVVKALSETDIGDDAAGSSSFISPHSDFNLKLYSTDTTKTMAGVAYDATIFLFDGSDQMPAEVGTGSFWKEMTAWISGDQDVDTTLKNIDESWPSS
jgi:alpha-glucoside transport system substrate-binding protein